MNTHTLSYSQAVRDALVTYKNYCWIFFLQPVFLLLAFIGSCVVLSLVLGVPLGIAVSSGYIKSNLAVILNIALIPICLFIFCWWLTMLTMIALKLTDESTLALENLIIPRGIKRYICVSFFLHFIANCLTILVIPGFIWLGRYGFAEYYALETNLPITECFMASRLLTAKRTLSLAIFSVFNYIFILFFLFPGKLFEHNSAAIWCFFLINLCVLLPIRLLIHAHLFRQLQSLKKESSEQTTSMKPDVA